MRVSSKQCTNLIGESALMSGYRYQVFKAGLAGGLWYIDFDMGSDYIPDFLYIPKIGNQDAIDEIGLGADPVQDGVYPGVWADSSPVFTGYESQDYFTELTGLSAERFWRVAVGFSENRVFSASKVYLGRLITFEKSPSVGMVKNKLAGYSQSFESASGKLSLARSSRNCSQFSIEIKLISAETVLSVVTQAMSYSKKYVVLKDGSGLPIFEGRSIWHGIAKNFTISKRGGSLYDMAFDFEEMA